jgi:hypothetical protein
MEAAYFKQMAENNVLALGTDEAFALRDKDGEIRCYKQRLRLSQKEGTLIQPVPSGPFVVSAQGYEVWSESAGACVIFPSDVLVDGKHQQNPFVYRDEKNGRILAIYCRAISFRFSSKGIPQVADWTTIFDTPSYRLIDLLAKAKQFPQAFRLLPAEMKPKEDGTWASYPFDEHTYLWVNTAHNEALTWYSQILNREKKAIDFAQTFARRNSLKHLSGLQKAPGPEWDITVLCWRPTSGNIIKWDATQYANLQKRVGSMINGDRTEFKSIEMQAGAEAVSDEQNHEAIEQTIDPDLAAEELPGTPADGLHDETANGGVAQEEKREEKQTENLPPQGKKGKLSKEDIMALNNLGVTKKEFPGEYAYVCKKLGIVSVITADAAKKVMAEIGKLIDQKNAA